MPNKPQFVYWDSCVFLSYINGEPEHLPILDGFFSQVETNPAAPKIITSTISKVEVAYAASEQSPGSPSSEQEAKIDILWADTSVIELVEFNNEIANFARKLIREAMRQSFSLQGMDAIHLASAEWVGVGEFHTYDKKLFKYKNFVSFTICEPYVLQLGMSF